MQCEIVVRRARALDERARAALIRKAFASYHWEAFIYFFFQELTLQCCVLGGAVLFIFLGVSVYACLLLVPAVAVFVALAVHITHLTLAEKHVQCMRKAEVGFVAELHGPLIPNPQAVTTKIVFEHDVHCLDVKDKPTHIQVVGTVSVSAYRGPGLGGGGGGGGWLHALAVHPEWQRRGVARALLAATRRHAADTGLQSLEAVTSQLQDAARSLLYSAGWQCRGSYHRPLCGAALTLLLAHFGADLPHA